MGLARKTALEAGPAESRALDWLAQQLTAHAGDWEMCQQEITAYIRFVIELDARRTAKEPVGLTRAEIRRRSRQALQRAVELAKQVGLDAVEFCLLDLELTLYSDPQATFLAHWQACCSRARLDQKSEGRLVRPQRHDPLPNLVAARCPEAAADQNAEIARRKRLLVDYKAATGASNRDIYRVAGKQHSCHKPQFYAYVRGELPADSEPARSLERFLMGKKPPQKPRGGKSQIFTW